MQANDIINIIPLTFFFLNLESVERKNKNEYLEQELFRWNNINNIFYSF